jgi:hypothetical protein
LPHRLHELRIPFPDVREIRLVGEVVETTELAAHTPVIQGKRLGVADAQDRACQREPETPFDDEGLELVFAGSRLGDLRGQKLHRRLEIFVS